MYTTYDSGGEANCYRCLNAIRRQPLFLTIGISQHFIPSVSICDNCRSTCSWIVRDLWQNDMRQTLEDAFSRLQDEINELRHADQHNLAATETDANNEGNSRSTNHYPYNDINNVANDVANKNVATRVLEQDSRFGVICSQVTPSMGAESLYIRPLTSDNSSLSYLGHNPKSRLNHFLQMYCSRPITKTDFLFDHVRSDAEGEEYQATLTLLCIGQKNGTEAPVFMGKVSSGWKEAEQEAAAAALDAYSEELTNICRVQGRHSRRGAPSANRARKRARLLRSLQRSSWKKTGVASSSQFRADTGSSTTPGLFGSYTATSSDNLDLVIAQKKCGSVGSDDGSDEQNHIHDLMSSMGLDTYDMELRYDEEEKPDEEDGEASSQEDMFIPMESNTQAIMETHKPWLSLCPTAVFVDLTVLHPTGMPTTNSHGSAEGTDGAALDCVIRFLSGDGAESEGVSAESFRASHIGSRGAHRDKELRCKRRQRAKKNRWLKKQEEMMIIPELSHCGTEIDNEESPFEGDCTDLVNFFASFACDSATVRTVHR